MENSIKILQITDFHLQKEPHAKLFGLDTEETFNGVLELIAAHETQFDLVLLTGDLSQDGSAESYQRLVNYLKPYKWPMAWIPGNHDESAVLAEVFSQAGLAYQRVIPLADWQIIMLDSTVPATIPGYLADSELDFLQQTLASNKKNALICLHHHPISIGSKAADQYQLMNAEAFWAIIKSFSHVKIVLCGHVHQAYEAIVNDVSVLTCPSTCTQLLPRAQELEFDKLGPGYRWLLLDPDGYYETGIRRIENFEGWQLYTYTACSDMA